MTRNLRTIRWWLLGGLGLGLALAAGLYRARPALPLPEVRHYGNLPEKFHQVLTAARARVNDSGGDATAVRQLAHLYHANRLFPEARTCYQMLAANPAGLTARDHYYLADLSLNDGDLVGAQRELRAVLAAEPGYLAARLSLAEVLFKSGDSDAAAKEYAAILAIEANHPQASVGLARIELQRGDDDAAVAHLEELFVAHPDLTAGAALFAKILERRGEKDRAVAFSQLSQQKAEPIPPDPWLAELRQDLFDVQLLGLRFEDYFKSRQLDQAFPLLERIEELDPASPVPSLLRGWAEMQAKQDPAAVENFRIALTKGGDPEKICPYLVQSLLKLGQVAEAAKLMAEHFAKRPDSVPLTIAYADVAVRQGDEKLARTLLTKVLLKEPYLQSQNMALAKILWTAGERDAAAPCLQRIAAAYATDVPSRALLGEYYLGKNDPVAAITPLAQAIKHVAAKTPAHAALTGLLGQAYLQAGAAETTQGRFAAAADYFEKAIQQTPTELNAYAGRANACVRLKQFARAAETLTQLVALQPANPTIYLSLGDVVYQDGKAAQARRHWEKARSLVAAGDRELIEALDLRLSGRITAETFQ